MHRAKTGCATNYHSVPQDGNVLGNRPLGETGLPLNRLRHEDVVGDDAAQAVPHDRHLIGRK